MIPKNTPPEPFGHFKAEPFGWTDCAETDDGAQPLYDQAAIDELGERLMVSDYALKDALRQRDALLAACDGVIAWDKARKFPIPYRVRDPIHKAIDSMKGGAS